MAKTGKRSVSSVGKRGLAKTDKRKFKRRDVPMADLLEWIVSRNPQQVVMGAAVAAVVVGLAVALIQNAGRGPDLSEWRDGPTVYTQIMAGRTDTSPVVALYLYESQCNDCRRFERDYLAQRKVRAALAGYDLVRVDVGGDASSSAIAAVYHPVRYPAFFILRPPPKPARQVHLHDATHNWLSVGDFLKDCNQAVIFPDVSRGGILATGDGQ